MLLQKKNQKNPTIFMTIKVLLGPSNNCEKNINFSWTEKLDFIALRGGVSISFLSNGNFPQLNIFLCYLFCTMMLQIKGIRISFLLSENISGLFLFVCSPPPQEQSWEGPKSVGHLENCGFWFEVTFLTLEHRAGAVFH